MENKSKQMLFSQDAGENRVENDFYTTPPSVTQLFLDSFKYTKDLENVWEPACGKGHISKVLIDNLINVTSSDLINRGYGTQLDFLKTSIKYEGHIFTNPPFKLAKDFVEKALELVKENKFCIFLLRIQFLKSKLRRSLFYKNIHSIYLYSNRIGCAPNGDESKIKKGMTYAWFVFKKGHTETPKIYWL